MQPSVLFNQNPYQTTISKENSHVLCFGPVHPAAHGVLRLILQLTGETITRLDAHIGLLHRGTEFLITQKHYLKGLPYFDRLDYVSMLTQEHVYCLAVENLQETTLVTQEINLVRILFDELTRVLNHLLAVSCHALDIGSMSVLFWAFESREKIMQFYENISGARMHAAYHKPVNFFSHDLFPKILSDIQLFATNTYTTLNEMHNVLTYSALWKQRLINIGSLSYENCVDYGLTGVIARSVGLKYDVRLAKYNSYSAYNRTPLKSYLGVNGDSYDRYLIRMCEMGESLVIVKWAIQQLQKNVDLAFSKHLKTFQSFFYRQTDPIKSYTSMETLIAHFLHWHTGFVVSQNKALSYIEAPKGFFGVQLHSNNSASPAVCKIRSPGYFNLQALYKLAANHTLADLAALIGTIDIVFGEVDR